MNQLQIIGRVGADAVIRDSNGRKFVSFAVAVDDNYKDVHGEKVERTQWFDVTFDKTDLSQWLKKGTQVFIQGAVRFDTYNDRDGKARAQGKVSARLVRLLGKAAETTTPATAQQAKPVPAGFDDDEANDLPF